MASHNPYAALEALPTEVLQIILSQMACTEDLSAVIWASPKLFQAFLGQREEILIRVIESSLDPGIFMEVLGFLHVPNYSNFNYVPGPVDARRLDMYVSEGIAREKGRFSVWWFLSRWYAVQELVDQFQREHRTRLEEGLEPGAPRPFQIPSLRRPVDQEQVVQFRREVNTVVEVFGKLKQHMEQMRTLSSFPFRDVWVPGAASFHDFEELYCNHESFEEMKSMRVFMRKMCLPEQRGFLQDLLRKRVAYGD